MVNQPVESVMRDSYFRLDRPIERPDQALVLHVTGCRTELAWNERLHRAHYGEDGPGYSIVVEREMFLADQMQAGYDFQNWFLDELIDQAYDRFDFCEALA